MQPAAIGADPVIRHLHPGRPAVLSDRERAPGAPRPLARAGRGHHAYRDGYSVLPRLKKLAHDPPFHVTPEDRAEVLRAKREITRLRRCFFEHGMDEAIYADACRFIVEHYPIPLDRPHTFDGLAMQIQEDLAIVRACGGEDW